MNCEYLLFNLVILAGPVIFSFESKVRFVSRWPQAFGAVGVALIPFVIWDVLVVQRHWWFNPRYTTGAVIAGLPVEEILFFVSAPFACLFVWDVFFANREAGVLLDNRIVRTGIAGGGLAAVPLLWFGYEYAGTVLLALTVVAGLDQVLRTRLLRQGRTYRYLGVVTLFILLFNGYLTFRPLVLYADSYLLGLRILTIPVEDFLYGYALVILTVLIYHRFRRERHA